MESKSAESAAAGGAAGKLAADSGVYAFKEIEVRLASTEDAELAVLLEKWGLQDAITARRWRFTSRFREEDADAFLQELMAAESAGVTSVQHTPLKATVLSMAFFDRLRDDRIVHEATDRISRCLDDRVEGVTVSDALRDMLVRGEESEWAGAFSEDDEKEVIYQLFKRLAIGGSMCQFEDCLQPYLTAVKGLYRDLMTVRKDVGGKSIRIHSWATKVEALEGCSLWDRESPHSLAMVVVDPLVKQATLLRIPFVAFW
eukprot:PLAT6576.2.p1 GENE.PLAT6576.2~~PLAT6576.2.p1  ORF type:complete len:269 (-),score=113.58 PLAT6576.2:84-857(-)